MRKSDTAKNVHHFRSEDRCFRMNGEWWFGTREGDQGPYRSQEHAKHELARYITMMAALEEHQEEAQRVSEKVTPARGDPAIWLTQQDVI